MTIANAETSVADTVRTLATTRVPIVAPDQTAAQVRDEITGPAFESARDLPVCAAGGRLVGVLRVEDLFARRPTLSSRP
jgi:CBS domain-containing protein